MNNKFLTRLAFLDKIGFDRSYSLFRLEKQTGREVDEEHASFLMSLLDSGTIYDFAAVTNAFNFTKSWVELGLFPTQKIMTRFLLLAFLDDRFVPQLSSLCEDIPTIGWVYRGLSKLVVDHFSLLEASIRTDKLVWTLLKDILMNDGKSKQVDPKIRYSDRDENCSFLIESLVLYWPSEITARLSADKLARSVVNFLLPIGSKTAGVLLSALAFAFPGVMIQAMKETDTLESCLSADALAALTAGGTCQISGAAAALKLFPLGPDLAMEVVGRCGSEREKAVAAGMNAAFDRETGTFTL